MSGYRGTGDVRLAVESGELAGACANWSSMRSGWAEALHTGEAVVVLAVSPRPIPELPGVPLAIDLARTLEGRRLVEIGVHDQGALARPYVLPPSTSPARVRLLRQAFRATLDDPAFRSEADRAKLEIDPVSGDELGQVVDRLSSSSRSWCGDSGWCSWNRPRSASIGPRPDGQRGPGTPERHGPLVARRERSGRNGAHPEARSRDARPESPGRARWTPP